MKMRRGIPGRGSSARDGVSGPLGGLNRMVPRSRVARASIAEIIRQPAKQRLAQLIEADSER